MNEEEPLRFGLQYLRGSYKGPKPPQFCRHCGSTMRITTEPDRYTPFDATTGERLFERHARCPKGGGWFDEHDHAVEDTYLDWAWL